MASTTEGQAFLWTSRLSLSKKVDITDNKQDVLKWNKEWEAAIASLTAADILKYHFIDDSSSLPVTWSSSTWISATFKKVQLNACAAFAFFDEGHFDTIWCQLLDAFKQRKHILGGLEKASEAPTIRGQDSHALCPEVTISNSVFDA